IVVSLLPLPLGCSQQAAKRPPPPHELRPDIVTGVINLPAKTELPEGAVAQVVLLQISESEVPGAMIASQDFPVRDPSEPPLFTLRFNPNAVDQTHRYVIRAKILIDGKVRYENSEGVQVLTYGHPPHAIVPVQPTG